MRGEDGFITVRGVSTRNGKAVAALRFVGNDDTAARVVENGVSEEVDVFWCGIEICWENAVDVSSGFRDGIVNLGKVVLEDEVSTFEGEFISLSLEGAGETGFVPGVVAFNGV